MEFGIGTYALGFLAGLLSILSPCVLPLLPIVLSTATSEHRWGPLAVSGGLMLSFTVAGLFVAAIGYSIGLSGDVFRLLAGVLLVIFAAALLVSGLQNRFSKWLAPLARAGDAALARVDVQGARGQFLVGALLGLVWAPCVGPTLGASSALAAQGKNLTQVAAVMMLFGFGAALPVAVLGTVSRRAAGRLRGQLLSVGQTGKRLLAVLMLGIALLVLSGADKRVEGYLVRHSPAWLTDLTTRF